MRPLFDAGMFFVSDLLGTLFFVGLYLVTKNVFLATAVGIGLSIAQMVWEGSRGRPVGAMQWLSLALVIVFGGATLITHNAVFIKVKPAVIYAVVGLVMLKPGWMTRYMPPLVIEIAPDMPRLFGFVWAGLMFATAAATLLFAYRFDTRAYAVFLGVFPLASKLTLFAAQYAVTRIVVVRRIRARRRAGEAPSELQVRIGAV